MKKANKAAAETAKALEGVKQVSPSDLGSETRWPFLIDVLMPRYSEGILTRRPGTLRIEARGTAWAVTLSCPTEGLQTIIVVDTVLDLFDVLERRLTARDLHWQQTWEASKRSGRAAGK